MKIGIAVSSAVHASALALVILGLGFGEPLPSPAVESIAVDLVPVEEFANIRKGTLDSDIIETDTPSMVEDDQPAELAQNTGNTEEDQPTPEIAPEASARPSISTAPEAQPDPVTDPAAEAAAPPEQSSEPPPAAETAPELPADPVAATEPPPEPVPQPETTPELAAPAADAEPVQAAPQPVTRLASLEQKRAEFAKQQEAKKKAEAEAKQKEKEQAEADAKKKKEQEAEKKRLADAKKKADEEARQKQALAEEADRISDIINNEQSRGGTTGQGGTPTVGKPTGTSARLTQSEMDGLVAQIKDQWNLMPSEIDSSTSVRIVVSLNPDGSVAGTPQVMETTASASVTRAAVLAVRKAAPYRLAQDKYDEWRQIDVTLQP